MAGPGRFGAILTAMVTPFDSDGALDVDGAIGIVRALLAIRAHAQWKDILPKKAEPWEVLSLLLALLELARRGELRLMQPRAFAAFEITRDSSSEAA